MNPASSAGDVMATVGGVGEVTTIVLEMLLFFFSFLEYAVRETK
jgi:hypothetical protein